MPLKIYLLLFKTLIKSHLEFGVFSWEMLKLSIYLFIYLSIYLFILSYLFISMYIAISSSKYTQNFFFLSRISLFLTLNLIQWSLCWVDFMIKSYSMHAWCIMYLWTPYFSPPHLCVNLSLSLSLFDPLSPSLILPLPNFHPYTYIYFARNSVFLMVKFFLHSLISNFFYFCLYSLHFSGYNASLEFC